MKLKSFGCSLIFGTDLPDDGRDGPYPTASQLTWPALLAKKFGYEYKTFARPGAGNLQILERLLCEINSADTAVYVIGWTFVDRFDYTNANSPVKWPGTNWRTLMPVDTELIAKKYFSQLHSEYSDKLRTLIYINTAIDCLLRNNCQFIMTYEDHLTVCQKWHTSTATSMLLDRVNPYLKNFEGNGFINWSRINGFEISDTMHPLAPAHKAAADLVFTEWNQYLCHSA